MIVVLGLMISCGVRLETASNLTPKPAPTARPTPDDNISRVIARPSMAFGVDAQVNIELFIESSVSNVYLIAGHGVSLNAEYDAVWYQSAQGTARLRFSLFTRATPESAWLPADSTDHSFFSTSAPFRDRGTASLWLSSDILGRFDARIETELLVRPPGGPLLTRVASVEFQVWVLPAIDQNPLTDTLLTPPLGKLDPERLFVDERLWTGGPCALVRETTDSEVKKHVGSACIAIKNNRLDLASAALKKALSNTTDIRLQANLNGWLGLLAMNTNQYEEANSLFDVALAFHLKYGDTLNAMIMLQNAAVAQAMAAGKDAPEPAGLYQALELHLQCEDYGGRAIVMANLGRLTKNAGWLNSAKEVFEQRDAPQKDIVVKWLEAI